MNGGLFDCLDKEDSKKKNLIIHIDGFSDEPANQPLVPDDLFFGKQVEIDLSDVYDDKRKKHEPVRGLIHILKDYKFTIAEEHSGGEELHLIRSCSAKSLKTCWLRDNPETGSTARKRTRSFYTPREIVNYMVDESLLAYLKEKMLKGKPCDGGNRNGTNRCFRK